MKRSKFPKQQLVAFVGDMPAHAEIITDIRYSAPSHRNMFHTLGSASLHICEGTGVAPFTYLDCFTSYLSLTIPSDLDRNFAKSICTKKNIPVGGAYIEVTWLKDVWMAPALWASFQDLLLELKKVNPKIIVVTGKWIFMLLSGLATLSQTRGTGQSASHGGLWKHRGSLHTPVAELDFPPCILLPILNPLYLYGIKTKEALWTADYLRIANLLLDLQRGKDVVDLLPLPASTYQVCLEPTPTLNALRSLLAALNKSPTLVAVDIETKMNCLEMIGFAYGDNIVLTIPFFNYDDRIASLWSFDHEVQILSLIYKVLLHPNMRLVGQNYLGYDSWWIERDWHIYSIVTHDTMLLQHTLFNKLPKDLGTIASLYVPRYAYWKQGLHDPFYDRCVYNGRDCFYTLEAAKELITRLSEEPVRLQEFYQFQMTEVSAVVVDLMRRGVKMDFRHKDLLKIQFKALCGKCEDKLAEVMQAFTVLAYDEGDRINWKSTKQVRLVLKDFLGIKPAKNRKTGGESFAYSDMLNYCEAYPQYASLLTLILEYKSLLVFTNTFLSMTFDKDNRFRTSLNVAGTSTARLASRKNAFGNSGNIQNISTGGTIELKYSSQLDAQEFEEEEGDEALDSGYRGITQLPNCKKLLLPDTGMTIYDLDYSAVDLWGVTMDSGCPYLIKELLEGRDVYSTIASEYYQRPIGKKDPERQIYKMVLHSSNYFGQAGTIALQGNLELKAVKRVQEFYFRLCPEVKLWHTRQAALAKKNGYIETVWGNRGWFLNVEDKTWLNQLLAYLPQSTAAVLVNKLWTTLREQEPTLQFLIQCHDSLVFQAPSTDLTVKDRVLAIANSVVVPYGSWDKPHICKQDFVIPVAIKSSRVSYGDCA
jgi:DNA polymerase I-like protein with 3'-5' exonuclease and polymerase domains